MQNEFIHTQAVNRFFEIGEEMQSGDSRIGPSLAMVTGLAGRGKTEAAKRFAVLNRALYIPPLNCRSASMLLRAIVFEMNGTYPHTVQDCMEKIESSMKTERRLLFIDEADLIPMSNLELLRNLSDLFNIPICLIGEDSRLSAKIHSRGRLSSRIRHQMEFEALSQADILLFFRKALGMKLTAEVCQVLHARCCGNWRPLLVMGLNIERALKTSGLNEISLQLAKAA